MQLCATGRPWATWSRRPAGAPLVVQGQQGLVVCGRTPSGAVLWRQSTFAAAHNSAVAHVCALSLAAHTCSNFNPHPSTAG